MPIEIIPGEVAFGSLTRLSRWPTPRKAKDRFLPYPQIAHTPGFGIMADDKLFTIGSCFAREVERALVQLGMQVLSSRIPGLEPGHNVTNKYTSRSILSDLKLAFEPGSDPTKTIYQLDDGTFTNLAFGGHGARGVPYSSEEIHALTQRYYENLRRLREANVVVITLGLVEAWFDKKQQVFLNIAPKPPMVRSEPGRFEVHVLSYEEIIADLEETLSILRRECPPGVRFLCTVSPVPLATTFRAQDCLQADMYSKCVQRAAVEYICMQNPDAVYFPSFEFVRLASPEQAWTTERDYRHVRPQMVERIMQTVIDGYVSEDERAPTMRRLRALKNEPDNVIRLVEGHMKQNLLTVEDLPVYMQWHYARAVSKRNNKPLAIALLKECLRRKPSLRKAQLLLDDLTH